MGQYINQDSKGTPLPATKKAAALIQDGATKLNTPPDTYKKNLVCVVENGFFDAATSKNLSFDFHSDCRISAAMASRSNPIAGFSLYHFRFRSHQFSHDSLSGAPHDENRTDKNYQKLKKIA